MEAIKHNKRPEVRQRAMGLRLLHEGKPPKEVAKFLSVSQPTVYDWHHRWQSQGVEGAVIASVEKILLQQNDVRSFLVLCC